MFASSLHFRALQDHALYSGSSNDFNARSTAASGSLIDGREHASLTDSESVACSQFITLAPILLIILRWHFGIAAIPGHAMPQIGIENACQLSVEVYACVPIEHLARQQRVFVDSTSTPSHITSDDQGVIRDKGGTAILEIECVTDMVPVLVSFSMNGIWWFSSRHLQLPMQCTVSSKMNYSCGSSALTVQQLACYGISLLVTISYGTSISVVETLMVGNTKD